jgi:hypothetical protein
LTFPVSMEKILSEKIFRNSALPRRMYNVLYLTSDFSNAGRFPLTAVSEKSSE